MAQAEYVVVELRVDATQSVSESARYADALNKAQQAADALSGSADKAQLAVSKQGDAMKQASAANDNLAKGYQAANDNFQTFGKSLADRAIDFIDNVNHLKLMAAAAYAMSPAFRSFANTEVTQGLALIGVNIDLVGRALAGIASVAAPALSFFARIAIPIGIVVAAWQALNYVITLGSGLLDKYANSERSLFASGVDDALTKLTKFQTDTVSLQQVQIATDLGNRLNDAKKTISDFFQVQLDLTDPALKLQAAWVAIVSTIAQGLSMLPDVTSKMTEAAQAIGNLPIWKFLSGGFGPPGALNPSSVIQGAQPQDNSQALSLARGNLGAALGVRNIGKAGAPLGGSFAARFSDDVNQLNGAGPTAAAGNSTNSYDRAIQSIRDQIDLLNLEAAGAGKTTEAYQELKVAHELNIAAMKAGIQPTDGMKAEWKGLADQIAAATVALNQNKVLMDETFKGQTQFLSPSAAAAANAARQIDPNNWQAHLQDAGPQLAAFNTELKTAGDLSYSFLDTFNQGLLNGQTRAQSLTNAMKGLESQLLQMAEKQAINSLFAGLFSLLGNTGGNPLATFATGYQAAKAANGMAFDRGNVIPFASGGIVGAPTLFRFAAGTGLMGEAGPEAIMPLQRTASGALGVAAAASKTNVQINNYTGDSEVRPHQQSGPDGETMIFDIMKKKTASGGLDAILKSRNGLRPQKVR